MNVLSKSKRPDRTALRLRLSVEQLEGLEPLVKRINGHWEEAHGKAVLGRQFANEAVKEALLCGEALCEAKGLLEHGQWLPWLRRHCGEVARCVTTAQSWMRLARANKQGVGFLEAHNLSAAYRMVGILPAVEAGAREEKEWTVERVLPWVGKLKGLRDRVKAWSMEERKRLAEELKPVVDLYAEIIPEAAR